MVDSILRDKGPFFSILDPFAGVGSLHALGLPTWGIELEYEWASQHPRNIVGDALHLPFADDSFDAVVTSPVYGNRMSDHHEAKDSSKRNTYRHTLGRPLTKGSSAVLQWGAEYRAFHKRAWREMLRVLDGWFILNCSDHIRKGKQVHVVDWHRQCAESVGFKFRQEITVVTKRNRQGQNHELRVDSESILLFTT